MASSAIIGFWSLLAGTCETLFFYIGRFYSLSLRVLWGFSAIFFNALAPSGGWLVYSLCGWYSVLLLLVFSSQLVVDCGLSFQVVLLFNQNPSRWCCSCFRLFEDLVVYFCSGFVLSGELWIGAITSGPCSGLSVAVLSLFETPSEGFMFSWSGFCLRVLGVVMVDFLSFVFRCC